MIAIRHVLLSSGTALFAAAVATIAYDVWLTLRCRRARAIAVPRPARWRMSVSLMSLAWAPMLIALSLFMTSADRTPSRPVAAPCTASSTNSPAAASAAPQQYRRDSRNCVPAAPLPAKR